jgi:hypothetical protein
MPSPFPARMQNCLGDLRSPIHTKHSLVQMTRQRIYKIAVDYEDCNDADFLQIDSALGLVLGKGTQAGAGQPILSGVRMTSWVMSWG